MSTIEPTHQKKRERQKPPPLQHCTSSTALGKTHAKPHMCACVSLYFYFDIGAPALHLSGAVPLLLYRRLYRHRRLEMAERRVYVAFQPAPGLLSDAHTHASTQQHFKDLYCRLVHSQCALDFGISPIVPVAWRGSDAGASLRASSGQGQ